LSSVFHRRSTSWITLHIAVVLDCYTAAPIPDSSVLFLTEMSSLSPKEAADIALVNLGHKSTVSTVSITVLGGVS